MEGRLATVKDKNAFYQRINSILCVQVVIYRVRDNIEVGE